MSETPFRAFPQFNDPELAAYARSRHRRGRRMEAAFPGERFEERIVAALMARSALTLKEILESFEVHARTRRRLRNPHLADLCCGHGLTGLLFACERRVQTVTLLDRELPESFVLVRDAIEAVAPWVAPKVRVVEAPLDDAPLHLEVGTTCVAVHACGGATDTVIDIGLALDGDIAVLGCCYVGTAAEVPPSIRKALGPRLATDVRRTQRLHDAGYQVDWSHIPEAISPMNRILVAWRSYPVDRGAPA